MNFSQLHERVRIEVLRRIENGSLNATLLAHQIDCSAAHISNFLNRRRRLSIDALDKVLRAQFLTIADLHPEGRYPQLPGGRPPAAMSFDSVPLVEPSIAASSARIPSGSIIDVVKVRSGLLGNLRDRCSAERRKWDRFVAVQMWEEEAALMQPVLPANAIVLIDRHYNSTFAYIPGQDHDLCCAHRQSVAISLRRAARQAPGPARPQPGPCARTARAHPGTDLG